MAKVWANALVITAAVGLSLYFVVETILSVLIAGSIPLFMVCVVIYLFFTTAIGIFLGTVARSMPQLGLLFMLVFLPMNICQAATRHWKACRPGLPSSCRDRRRRISSPSRSPSCIAGSALGSCGRSSWPPRWSAACSSALLCCDSAL